MKGDKHFVDGKEQIEPSIEELVEEGTLVGTFNVYYTNPKCDSVDYSLRFYTYKGKNWLYLTRDNEIYPASDIEKEKAEFEERYGYTEDDGYWS